MWIHYLKSLNLFFLAFGHSYLPSDCIFPESIVEMHVIEGADATSEFPLLPDLPGYKEWAKNKEYNVFIILMHFFDTFIKLRVRWFAIIPIITNYASL